MRLSLICSILTHLITSSFSSATEVEGEATGVWRLDDSPFIMVGDAEVPSERELLIEPGVIVQAEARRRLVVHGRLLAIGTEEDSILFTADNPNQPWGGIRIINATGASVFEHCAFEWATQIADYPEEDSRGGALYLSRATAAIRDCHFRFNRSSGEGGALCSYNSEGEITRCLFSQNFGFTEIVWLESSDVPVTDSRFLNNTGNYCAGLELSRTSSSVINNVFMHNSSDRMSWGQGIYLVWEIDPIIRNNLIADNEGAGGMFIGYGAHPREFSQNTIVNNTGRTGIFMVNGGILDNAVNCIIRDNSGTDIELFDGTASISFSNLGSAPGTNQGDGMLDVDPLFVNPNQGDYRLSMESPCRNAGDPDSPRDPDGTRADIGCYFAELPIDFEVNPESLLFDQLVPGERADAEIQAHYVQGEMDQILLTFNVGRGDEWLSVAPMEALMEIDDVMDIRVTVDVPQDAEAGELHGQIDVTLEEAPRPFLTIPCTVTVMDEFGQCSGTIIDALTQDPVEGAVISVVRGEEEPRLMVTNENGEYVFPVLPIGEYSIEVTHRNFLRFQGESFRITPDERVERNFELLFATCEPSPTEIDHRLTPNTVSAIPVTLANEGNGLLNFEIAAFFMTDDSDWLTLFQSEGEIDPQSENTFDVAFSSRGYQHGDTLQGELRITHSGRGFNSTIPVRLIVDNEAGVRDDGLMQAAITQSFRSSPNPFNSSTTLSFELPRKTEVTLRIFDLSGRDVATLVSGSLSAGKHELVWHADNITAGLYLATLAADGVNRSERLLLLR